MKIFWKIFLSILSIVIIMYMTLGGALLYVSFNRYLNSEVEKATNENKMFMLTLKTSIEANMINSEDLGMYMESSVVAIKKNMGNAKTQIRVFDNKWNKIYADKGVENLVKKQDIKKQKNLYVINKTEGKHYLETMSVLKVNDKKYYISIMRDIEQIYNWRDQMTFQYMAILAVALVVSGVLSYVTAKKIAKPIVKLTRTTKNMAIGNYSVRADVKNGGEIGVLTKNFNTMADAMEKNIRQLEDAARAKEEFTASFAHELKTPLTAIVGYSDMLRSMELDKKDITEFSNYIFTQGKRLEKLSYTMMDLISIDKKNIEINSLSMKRLIQKVSETVRPLLKQKKIHYKVTVEEAKIQGNSELLISLFTNIIDNSRKAVEENGNILVNGKRNGDTYSLSIADDGCGMEESEIKKITEAFYMIDKSRARKEGGAGIGMALCEKIVNVHKAQWNISSEPGKGTEVTITFTKVEGK